MGMSQRIHFWYQVFLKMLIFFQKIKKKTKQNKTKTKQKQKQKQNQKQNKTFFFVQKIFGKAKIESLSWKI